MKKIAFLSLAAAVTTGAALALAGQDVQEASAPSPEMMARMTPGPMHAKLDPLIGSWKAKGQWRTAPDAPWQEFEATVEREWILDGRFVREDVDSEFMDQPFHGIGMIGYDNVREHFTNVWVDSMSTGTWLATGRMEGSKLILEGTNSDPMTGQKDAWSRSIANLGADRQTYEGYARDENGEEFVNMKMTLTKM